MAEVTEKGEGIKPGTEWNGTESIGAHARFCDSCVSVLNVYYPAVDKQVLSLLYSYNYFTKATYNARVIFYLLILFNALCYNYLF